jgi:hypothetical protein
LAALPDLAKLPDRHPGQLAPLGKFTLASQHSSSTGLGILQASPEPLCRACGQQAMAAPNSSTRHLDQVLNLIDATAQ